MSATEEPTPARTISDSDALDELAARYKMSGQEDIFECMSSTIEFIGDLIERTARKAWFEEPGYLTEFGDG